MQPDRIVDSAVAQVGGYLLMQYRDERGVLHAANAVSALGAWAGIFAQIQARAMMIAGVIPTTDMTLLEVKTSDGQRYFFGDAINACLLEGNEKFLSFWNLAASAARDPDVAAKLDVLEIARRTSQGVGGAMFGLPRIDPAYQLSERPIDAVRKHGPTLKQFFLDLELDPSKLMLVFGAVAQHFAVFAAGEAPDMRVGAPMTRLDIVRLYMEAAIPMSKLDTGTVGMA
ncbi:MAG TPA: hypothetical protein VEA80_10630 [Vitreimonas sp.]|uniref:hypothetical protein n=1 Tax=Vitreimonas sp. TaxID=3069702 RepID=UPI002D53F458|nr:hypothetical protein [Vitreimonas sp.]HYD87921.1 hypothetical protein [Vitreimonas sp.]